MANEPHLVDTNLLLRFVDARSPQHPIALNAVQALSDTGSPLPVVPQNLIEFWNVATRPTDKNGFGFAPSQAENKLQLIETQFVLLPDTADIFPKWRELALSLGVSGVQVHDTRLVATMLVHGISRILTFNFNDFKRFAGEGIEAIDPNTV